MNFTNREVFLSVVLGLLLLALLDSTLTSGKQISTLESTIAQLKATTLDQEKEQYARGMFDVCAGVLATPEQCLKVIQSGLDMGWFNMNSPGFRWPILDPNQQTN